MKYIQFYHMSTGYVEGSIPPRFDEANKKPIEACGSENVYVLDGRLHLHDCLRVAYSEMQSPKRHRCVGFRLMRGRTFADAKPWSDYIPRTDCE